MSALTSAQLKALAAIGTIGGSVKSAAKTKAARANAKKGGWPKGKKRGPRKETK